VVVPAATPAPGQAQHRFVGLCGLLFVSVGQQYPSSRVQVVLAALGLGQGLHGLTVAPDGVERITALGPAASLLLACHRPTSQGRAAAA